MSSGIICDQISWNNLTDDEWDYFDAFDWDNFVFYLSPGDLQQFYYNTSLGTLKTVAHAIPSMKVGVYAINSGLASSQARITKGFDSQGSNIKVSTSVKE